MKVGVNEVLRSCLITQQRAHEEVHQMRVKQHAQNHMQIVFERKPAAVANTAGLKFQVRDMSDQSQQAFITIFRPQDLICSRTRDSSNRRTTTKNIFFNSHHTNVLEAQGATAKKTCEVPVHILKLERKGNANLIESTSATARGARRPSNQMVLPLSSDCWDDWMTVDNLKTEMLKYNRK